VTVAAVVQESIAVLTHSGTGTVMGAEQAGVSRLVCEAPHCRKPEGDVEEDSRRDSNSSRYRSTTVLLNAIRGSEQYHEAKSSIANR
jgi:hypothetical protein